MFAGNDARECFWAKSYLLFAGEEVNGETDELGIAFDQSLQPLLLQKLKAILLWMQNAWDEKRKG